jgi:hypothetical protein
MSISDAKDPASWQIGFEDGIKFVITNKVFWKSDKEREFCQHFWIAVYTHDIDKISFLKCRNCGINKKDTENDPN